MHKKTPIINNMMTETEILDRIRNNELQLPPLTITPIYGRDPVAERGRGPVSLPLEVAWEGRRYEFVVKCLRTSTPKVFQEAVTLLKGRGGEVGKPPILVAPYLSSQQIKELEANRLSGIDLSGNGVVVVPGEVLVCRMGATNRYPESTPIRNVFRGNSSVVTRAFLLQAEYPSVNAIKDFIGDRGGNVAISTVSKVVKRLEEELMVGRSEGAVGLLQPEKLLDQLAQNYRPPRVQSRFFGKMWSSREQLLVGLEDEVKVARGRVAMTGLSSVGQYAVMAREEKTSLYVARLSDRLANWLRTKGEEGDRFWNLELLETDERAVYFDLRQERCYPWASPVQVYLELLRGDKRDRETAEQVKLRIVSDLGPAGRGGI